MIKENVLGNVRAIFGMHVDSFTPTGSIHSRSGPACGAVAMFEVTIFGKGGHAGFPHKSADPILGASFAIMSLQQLISRETDPLDSQLISVGFIKAGGGFNVIPNRVKFGGTLRSITTDGLLRLMKRLKEVVEEQARVNQCTASVDFLEESFPIYPAVHNSDNLHNHVQQIGKELLGLNNVKVGQQVLAGEDFSFYQRVIPGVILGIGIRNEKIDAVHSPHSPYFFVDEDVLPIGAGLNAALAETYLNKFVSQEKENSEPGEEKHTEI
eukprot:TRINITY_DN6070_c0_g2_i2.p1 TRINITY_DN6070_c0_g2~~TRINITY_DN6070_c0_g2_i2.p1  ORF type:complete len:268 (+),score=76.49 TRINITY_DN6070_c0_g2_i2:254-1057(+)